MKGLIHEEVYGALFFNREVHHSDESYTLKPFYSVSVGPAQARTIFPSEVSVNRAKEQYRPDRFYDYL